MRIAGQISFEKGLWNIDELVRQNNLLKSYDLPVEIPKFKSNEIMKILMGDKKVKDGKMRFILPTRIGEVGIYENIKESEFLKYFN